MATALVTAAVTVSVPLTVAVGAWTATAVPVVSASAGTGADSLGRLFRAAGSAARAASSAAPASVGVGEGSMTIAVTIPERSAPACPADVSGSTNTAPSMTAGDGAIAGTSSADLAQFAASFNAIRVANCLEPVPTDHFVYDSCMEQRLIWMAEDPSTDPASAWGHEGSVRSDGLASVGCDGNLAGGSDNTSETVAQKWWDSPAHRASLFRPDIPFGVDDVCVRFAMTHGGVPNEPYSFTRAAARWTSC
ncbi:hypothetical protein L3i23_03120 [Herbiconiux sp. L3-i23]|nr:hypothetical protein L3i23_03120 [Herbiconiux sp. L3-i23]